MEEKLLPVSQLKPQKAFSIFCGMTIASDRALIEINQIPGIQKWQTHVFRDNRTNELYNESTREINDVLIEELKSLYYPSFVECLFPSDSSVFSSKIKSYTVQINSPKLIHDKTVQIDYLDLFFFPENHLIYCFKCNMSSFTANEIITLNSTIRSFDINEIESIYQILSNLTKDIGYNIGSKLKLFTYIEHDFDFDSDYTSDNMLFDLATCSEIGSSVGLGREKNLKPSKDFFNYIMTANKISVFENWSALCLFDSFTVIQKSEMSVYNWEFMYFRFLYIHSLFIKSYLVGITREFYSEQNQNIDNLFHEFNKNFNLTHISYNFLPQMIYDKIRLGLNLENELSSIRSTIEQDYTKRQEKRQLQEVESDKITNKALFIVAILAVFDTVYHGGELTEIIIKVEKGPFYSVISSICIFLIYFLIFYVLMKRKKFSKKLFQR